MIGDPGEVASITDANTEEVRWGHLPPPGIELPLNSCREKCRERAIISQQQSSEPPYVILVNRYATKLMLFRTLR